jgi:hypothetical protein
MKRGGMVVYVADDSYLPLKESTPIGIERST